MARAYRPNPDGSFHFELDDGQEVDLPPTPAVMEEAQRLDAIGQQLRAAPDLRMAEANYSDPNAMMSMAPLATDAAPPPPRDPYAPGSSTLPIAKASRSGRSPFAGAINSTPARVAAGLASSFTGGAAAPISEEPMTAQPAMPAVSDAAAGQLNAATLTPDQFTGGDEERQQEPGATPPPSLVMLSPGGYTETGKELIEQRPTMLAAADQIALSRVQEQELAEATANRVEGVHMGQAGNERALELRRKELHYDKIAQLEDIHAQTVADLERDRAEKIDIDAAREAVMGPEGSGRRIAMALALAMRSYAAAITGQPDDSLEMLNGWIDQDLAKQRSNIDQKRGERDESRRNMIAFYQERFGNEEMAIEAARAQLQQDAAMSLKQIGASAGSEQARINAGRAAAEMEASAAETRVRLTQMIEQQYRAPVFGSTGGGAAPKTPASEAKVDSAVDKLVTETKEDVERASKAGKYVRKSNAADGRVGTGTLGRYLPNALVSDEVEEYRSADIVHEGQIVKGVAGAGVVTEGERKAFAPAAGRTQEQRRKIAQEEQDKANAAILRRFAVQPPEVQQRWLERDPYLQSLVRPGNVGSYNPAGGKK
jgi:hypothetical protein